MRQSDSLWAFNDGSRGWLRFHITKQKTIPATVTIMESMDHKLSGCDWPAPPLVPPARAVIPINNIKQAANAEVRFIENSLATATILCQAGQLKSMLNSAPFATSDLSSG